MESTEPPVPSLLGSRDLIKSNQYRSMADATALTSYTDTDVNLAQQVVNLQSNTFSSICSQRSPKFQAFAANTRFCWDRYPQTLLRSSRLFGARFPQNDPRNGHRISRNEAFGKTFQGY